MDKNTIQHIDELLQYLPKFSTDTEILNNTAINKKDDEIFLSLYPAYDKDVVDFFRLLENDFWIDPGYSISKSSEDLYNDDFISNASLNQLKSLLTFCRRGERFCSGFWYGVIIKGRIKLILERLSLLKNPL